MPISGIAYEFTDQNVENAPESAGVYALYDGYTIVYIGMARGGSETIRSRLIDHKSGRLGPCTQTATMYKRETTDSPAARQEELLQEFRLLYSRLPLCNEAMR